MAMVFTPTDVPSPAEIVRRHTAAIEDAMARLVADNERLKRREIDLTRSAQHAINASEAFKDQLRQKDELISELRYQTRAT